MKSVIISLVSLFSLFTASMGVSVNYDPKDTNNNNAQTGEQWWTNWNYSIDKGQCTGRQVASEDVRKTADPYTVKKTIYSWDGQNMYRITCIKVRNAMYNDRRAGQARVVKGGVGYSEIRIEMSSQVSEGFHFTVEIWAEPLQQRHNMAIMTDPNSRSLYYGSQKYCACD